MMKYMIDKKANQITKCNIKSLHGV